MTGKWIEDVPVEVLVLIFKCLSIQDVFQNCVNTCVKWRYITAQYFMKPYLLRLANYHKNLKDSFQFDGWTEECNDHELIISLCEKHTSFKCISYDVVIPLLEDENSYQRMQKALAETKTKWWWWSKNPILFLPGVFIIIVVVYFTCRHYGLIELLSI